ncbi:MAG TPA: rhamnulokinase family protein [Verrucomicrobiae bacterium]|jgi:sugar (pentulose or hexulose) kinase|nr:rhamnulokinase family protein [Verrucomicrobiae bacterium]
MALKRQVHLAVDLGAGSGRVLAGVYDGARLEVSELSRFPNSPVKEADGWHWNIEELLRAIKQGIAQAARQHGAALVSIGVDTWGVDYGLLDHKGELIARPFQYRDSRTQGMPERAERLMPRRAIYERTGIQFMFFNTLYQLLAEGPRLERAARLLFLPDLLHYFLTGIAVNEKSIASTSQLLNPRTQQWDSELISAMGLPAHLFGATVEAGAALGALRPELAEETGAKNLRVITPAGHDTASAVAGVPAEESEPVFLSSGTWSLLGRELAQPVISESSYEASFSNEGGVFGTTRFLKNITGMWILQECLAAWSRGGAVLSYPSLFAGAQKSGAFAACLDPNAPEFDAPADMLQAIAAFGARTAQTMPSEPAAVTRMVLESLALKCRFVKEALARVTGKAVTKIHIIGGGSQNDLLNQFTADALNCVVIAGPVEAASVGNIAMQLHGLGELGSLSEVRALVCRSVVTKIFEPQRPGVWDEAAGRFQKFFRL